MGGLAVALAAALTAVAVALAAAPAAVTATTVAAQAKPDFAGRWTTDPPGASVIGGQGSVTGGQGSVIGGQASATGGRAAGAPGGQPGAGRAGGGRGAAGDMGSGWGSPLTITQDARQLTVEYAFFGRGDLQPPLRFVYALDGSETKNSVMMGRGLQAQVSRTAWDAEKLVITTIHTFADPATGKPIGAEVKQVLSLESPVSLVVETTRAGVLGGPATTTRTVYRKL